MMAAINIDSPLMSRNIVEIFDIIESVSIELEGQRRAISQLAELLGYAEMALRPSGVENVLGALEKSAEYCLRMLK